MNCVVKVLDLFANVQVEDGKITGFEFTDEQEHSVDDVCQEIQTQCDLYTKHQLTTFDLPLKLIGTEFQNAVWRALIDIPYGETRSYKDIAVAIGRPKAYRAVGSACNRNPIGLIVPCHRVIGSQGSLTGYAGGLDLKEKLLNHEKTAL